MMSQVAQELSVPRLSPFDLSALLCEPIEPTARQPDSVRAVFISDTHLGCAYAQAGPLIRFLSELKPEFIYLVGDFIDGYELRRRFAWTTEFTRVLSLLLDKTRCGSQIRYVIGNHDDFLRTHPFLTELVNVGGLEIANEFTHVTSDRRRFLVLHGDHFDDYEKSSTVYYRLLGRLYNGLLAANFVATRVVGGPRAVISKTVKSSLGTVRRHIAKFRDRLSSHAKVRGFDGVICGHIHSPEQSIVDGIEYCNTGDWLENCTAIVERNDGSLELHYADERTTAPV